LSVVLGVLSYVYNRYQKLFLDDEWLAEVMMEQRQLHKRRRRKRGL
jgi:hypothetical protein